MCSTIVLLHQSAPGQISGRMSASALGPAVQSGTVMTVSGIGADSVSFWPFLLQGGGAFVPGLSHMIFSKLPEKTAEELIIPPGSFELSLHRAFGPFQPGQVERQSA